MNTQLFVASVGLMMSLSAMVLADERVIGQGVIRFHGRIVEAPCEPNTGSDVDERSVPLRLDHCLTPAGRTDIRVDRIDPVRSMSAPDHSRVKVKLIKNSGQGAYYDQHYTLVDEARERVRSGTYLVTLTSP